VSSFPLAEQFDENLRHTHDHTDVVPETWQQSFPTLPRRHLCTGSVSLPQNMSLNVGAQTGFFVTPVPEVRGERDPFGMTWMTDVFVDEWAAIAHPSLGAAVVNAPNYTGYNARMSRDSLSYLSPRALMTAGEPLEAQVARPRFSLHTSTAPTPATTPTAPPAGSARTASGSRRRERVPPTAPSRPGATPLDLRGRAIHLRPTTGAVNQPPGGALTFWK
jgi:hypothetical protein